MLYNLLFSVQGTLQVIVSTDGMASFVTFLFNDGHGIRILEETDILIFVAGDTIRRSDYLNDIIDLQILRLKLNSFRIDGNFAIFKHQLRWS